MFDSGAGKTTLSNYIIASCNDVTEHVFEHCELYQTLIQTEIHFIYAIFTSRRYRTSLRVDCTRQKWESLSATSVLVCTGVPYGGIEVFVTVDHRIGCRPGPRFTTAS